MTTKKLAPIIAGVNYKTEDKGITKGITYDNFLDERLKKLYSKKRRSSSMEQLYSRVEYELNNYLMENRIHKGSKEQEKLIILLKTSISDVRPGDTISMGSLIFASIGLFVAIIPNIVKGPWIVIFYLGYCFSVTYIMNKADKWFGYSGEKMKVLNMCLNILESQN